MEIWKPVVGFEGLYEVSNIGNIRSCDRIIVKGNGVIQHRKGHPKKLRENSDGYIMVKLSSNGRGYIVGVHILVAKAFVDGYKSGYEVNHRDYNRSNNEYTNLEWVSHSDNIKYSLLGGRHISQIRNFKGCDNPNYNNHKLHNKYTKSPDLAKEKQSRPSSSNGRAKAITMLDSENRVLNFSYIRECAIYMINNSLTSAKTVSCVARNISHAAKYHEKYCNFTFLF